MTGEAVPASLPLFRQRVREEWIDYNGHLSEAYYVLVFGFATDALMDHAGLDAAYRERTGCSLYTVEAHVRYLREVGPRADLAVRTTVLGVDGKKVRLLHEMLLPQEESADGTVPVVATEELMALHVDGGTGRTSPFPERAAGRLAALHRDAPEWAGRGITPVPAVLH
ncbi:thioesterase family protein [Streptomyces sp. NPDC059740]|uniref:thioesterase family protein n=1 Tax=Streptomyces sp. NPDC059740 TaxID=3346926 RepID=UPI00365D5F8B